LNGFIEKMVNMPGIIRASLYEHQGLKQKATTDTSDL